MLRIAARSPPSLTEANDARVTISRRTIRISSNANVAPRQRRTPPPNGIHV